MAKKAGKSKIGVSKTPPKSEAVPLGTKAAKKHERQATTSEAERLERGRKLATTYLVERDGMDEDLAATVIASMSLEDVNELISEANTAVLNRSHTGGSAAVAGTNGDLGGTDAITDAGPAGDPVTDEAAEAEAEEDEQLPDYSEVEVLAAEPEFHKWVVLASEAAKAKNRAEKVYKDTKKKLIQLMLKAKVEGVGCIGYKLSLYKGHHVSLDEKKLLEAGVPADQIVKGWKDTPYDDVRITPPKD